jgi:exodeoxyribonuclease III
MKIATWNVNGIRAREAQLCDWLERDQPDVLCLQEIKARPDQVPDRCKLGLPWVLARRRRVLRRVVAPASKAPGRT